MKVFPTSPRRAASPSIEMSFRINCGEASDYVKAYREKFKKALITEITKNLVREKLSIKPEKYFSEQDDVEYKRFINTAATRITGLMQKIVKYKAYSSGKLSRNDIIIDIEVDCPDLIPTDSQTLSQASSTTSNMSSSQSRVLEYLNLQTDQIEPEPVKRKAFDDLGLQLKRLRSA